MSVLNKLSDLRFMRGVVFGLDRIEAMAKLLNVPRKSAKIIHVAGTNGKGSVVTKLSYYLRHFGYCTGTFLSPHVNTFRERIIVDGKMITEEESIPLLEEIFNVSENNHIEVTYFETLFLLSLLFFKLKKTDYAVIEVGLGGKNDATNIVIPEISVITSVSLDHTKILGSTVEEICKEKAGIIKDNKPIVCGPHCPIDLLCSISKDHNSPFYPVSIKEDCSYDEENTRICKKCIEILCQNDKKLKINDDIDDILSIRPSCRFEWITSLISPSFFPSKLNKDKSIEILCDACHNPHAFEYMIHDLLKYDLKENKDIIYHVIVGMCVDKDCKNNLKEILKMKNLKSIVFTKSQNERSADPQYLLEQFKEIANNDHFSSIPDTVVSKDVENSIYSIKSIISSNIDKNQVIVICGSFFVMSEARKCLGIVEESDLVDMNEIWNKK